MTEQMREAFEKWATNQGHQVAKWLGNYLIPVTERAWEAWQAALSQPSVEVEEVRELVEAAVRARGCTVGDAYTQLIKALTPFTESK